jgi:hypothetical protein
MDSAQRAIERVGERPSNDSHLSALPEKTGNPYRNSKVAPQQWCSRLGTAQAGCSAQNL